MQSDDDSDDSVLTSDGPAIDKVHLTGFESRERSENEEKRSEAAPKRTLAQMNHVNSALLFDLGAGKDIFGTWQIDCPGIYEGWPHCNSEGMRWIDTQYTSEHVCHGVFDVEFGGPWEFTGTKVSLKTPRKHPGALAKEYEKLGRVYDETTSIW